MNAHVKQGITVFKIFIWGGIYGQQFSFTVTRKRISKT